jgi:nucleoside-diphosphate-sugar epimerase
MTYLVTGGTGLVGSRIVRDLVREGDQVVIYDLLPARSSLEQLMSEEEIGSMVKIVQGEITDAPHLFRTVKENNVERIIHTASLLVLDSNANPYLAVKVNCEGTICVFEAARALGVKKVVWSSSNACFGPPEKYAEEYIPNDAPHYPQNVYAGTKAFNEVVAAYYVDHFGVDITGIRYMHVYGAGVRRGFFATVLQELILNPALEKPGRVPHGDAIIGWSYVYSIMGDIHTVREAADYVREIIPGADITVSPGGFTGDPVKFDTRLIENEVGYRPQWSMERGIKEAINLVRREHDLPPI